MLLFMQEFAADRLNSTIEKLQSYSFHVVCRRYMAEILPIRRKTPSNQSINSCCVPSAILLDALESHGTVQKHWLNPPKTR